MFEPQITPDPLHDYCDRAGAKLLQAKIEAYWKARGASVQVSVREAGFHPAIRHARFDVRSDMLNGMPRKASDAVKREAA